MSPETATHVDGAKLIDWLEGLNLIDEQRAAVLGDRWDRAVRAWKNEGRIAHVYTVDEFLTAIGVPLGMMPDDCWTSVPRKFNTQTKVTPEVRERMARLRSLDWTLPEIAAMVGLNRSTVQRHLKAAS